MNRSLLVAAISDTHLYHKLSIPEADVLIHAGDVCIKGQQYEFEAAMEWLGAQTPVVKLYVPGNHDAFAYRDTTSAYLICIDRGVTMLIDQPRIVEGFTFYGAPWSKRFGRTQAFAYDQEHDYNIWAGLRYYAPKPIDVLITHTPPNGILDTCPKHEGSPELRRLVAFSRPQHHIFGHIHDGHGQQLVKSWHDGSNTKFANVARMDECQRPATDDIYTFLLTTLKS